MLAKIFLVALITLFAAGEPACPYAGVNLSPAKIRPPASPERLQERAEAYYAALAHHDFGEIWEHYLSVNAREESKSKREFAVGMARFFAEVKVVKAPVVKEIKTSREEKEKRQIGKTETQIDIKMAYGGKFNAVHTTVWVWEDHLWPTKPDSAFGDWWLLNQDEIKATAPASR